MRNALDIFAPIQSDDWLLVILIVVFLLSFLSFVPRHAAFFKLTGSLFKFKSIDGEVTVPQTNPAGFVLQSFLACLSISLLFTCSGVDEGLERVQELISLACYMACIVSVFVVKLVLYQLVNTRLYKSQTTSLKPTRWNGFFVSAFSVAGNAALLLCVITVFFPISYEIVRILFVSVAVLLEIGLVFKIKTAIFRNKCTILIFFLYLCALELGPLALLMVLWGNLIS